MNRLIVVVASGLALSACNSGFMQGLPSLPNLPSLPSFDSGSLFSPQPVTVNVETSPVGAEATSSVGGSCRTPCSLVVKTTRDFVVNVALPGHQPQAVPVKVLPPEDPRFVSDGSARGARSDPDQIFAELKLIEPARRTGSHSRR